MSGCLLLKNLFSIALLLVEDELARRERREGERRIGDNVIVYMDEGGMVSFVRAIAM